MRSLLDPCTERAKAVVRRNGRAPDYAKMVALRRIAARSPEDLVHVLEGRFHRFIIGNDRSAVLLDESLRVLAGAEGPLAAEDITPILSRRHPERLFRVEQHTAVIVADEGGRTPLWDSGPGLCRCSECCRSATAVPSSYRSSILLKPNFCRSMPQYLHSGYWPDVVGDRNSRNQEEERYEDERTVNGPSHETSCQCAPKDAQRAPFAFFCATARGPS